MDRRSFLKAGLVATAATTALGSSAWRAVFASHPSPQPGDGPYGPLGPPDANGVRLPAGFSSRVVARSHQLVPGTGYVWHTYPDGGATFATGDGGWIYVSNSEVIGAGGVGAVRFAADGEIEDAYRILAGSSRNCAGGSTPWGTWLSCEEMDQGIVWECDPTGATPAIPRPALGVFKHEAAVVDPATGIVYMTEDEGSGLLYRFVPARAGDLSEGVVDAAKNHPDGTVTWRRVPNPIAVPGLHSPTRFQVPGATAFLRGEGAWFDASARSLYFCTTGDARVWVYDTVANRLEVLFDGKNTPGSPLDGADNVTVSRAGEVFVCEDGGDLQIVMVAPEGVVAPVVQVTGAVHTSSELTGVAFDPSGRRMYFSSQRAYGAGVTFEVTGPFRGAVA